MKTKFTTLMCLLWYGLFLAQTTIVSYQFNNNLTADAGALGSPSLLYYNGSNNLRTPSFSNNMLSTDDQGDYLELSVDASSQQNMILSFYGDFAAWFIAGNWIVSSNTGAGNAFEQIGFSTYYSIFNIRTGGDYSVNLPESADNKGDLKIRIRANFVAIGGNLRLDNLKLSGGTPKIKIYTDNNTPIPHLSGASVALNTDFGTLQTSDPVLLRTFRVRNYLGTNGSQLNVTDITITGANPGDFAVTPTTLSNIGRSGSETGTPFKTFDIGFLPLADGIRTAEINVFSNAAPSPYTFTVIGTGASCSLTASTFAINTMAAGQQSLEANFSPSTDVIGGPADNSPQNSLNATLYPNNNNLLLSSSSPTAWYVRNGTKEVEFGGASGLDISEQKNVSIEFNVAAFGTSSSTGVNTNAYITLSVQKPDASWSEEMTLRGSTASGTYYRYAFGTADVYSAIYDGNNVAVSESNRDPTWSDLKSYRFKVFRLGLPVSAGISSLKFKIKASTPNMNALWLIDDVKVVTSNAVFKTFTTANVWSPSAPTQYEKAVIQGNYTNAGDAAVCECEVESGSSLTIPAGTSVTVRGKIINDGIFTVKSDGNLLQLEAGAVNTGNINVERSVAGVDNIPTKMDYIYWSSPVANQNLQAFSPGTPAANFLQYKEATDFFVTTYDGVFHPAKGYAIRAETTGVPTPSYSKTYTFGGVPNNGDYPFTITRSPDTGKSPNVTVHGYNLVGNPYPSNIDFDKLYQGNSSKIYNTAWFWTNDHANPPQQGSGYDGANYAIYNGTGGSTPNTTSIIKVGQGFLVQNKGAENSSSVLNFQNSYGKTNLLRVKTPGRFYQRDSSSRNRYWLKLISPDDIVNTQLIGYIEGATDDFEQDYDAEIMGMSSDIFYSTLGDKRLLIQGKGSFKTTDKVGLGANFFKAGTYTLALETGEGIFNGAQKIYLRDKETGAVTELSANPYIFEATKGLSEGRFEIVYEPQAVLAAEGAAGENLIVYREGGDFVVRAQSKMITDLEVYDGAGRLIYKVQPRRTEVRIAGEQLLRGVYILKIDQSGQLTKKKILK